MTTNPIIFYIGAIILALVLFFIGMNLSKNGK